MNQTMDAFAYFWDKATKDDPTWSDTAIIIGFLVVFWLVFIEVGTMILAPMIYNKPWLVAAADRDYHISSKKLWEALGDPKTLEEHRETFQRIWPWMHLVLLQHLIGGVLCLPSIFNLFPNQGLLASNLTCLAILSEAGWEIGDILSQLYKRFFTNSGQPTGVIVLLIIHHSLATFVGVPMTMYYRDWRFVHWLCFDLQVAGASVGLVAEYSKLLDVSKPSELLQFQILSFFAFMMNFLTRGVHWVYLCYQVLYELYAQKQWTFLVIASVMSALFSVFNYAICIVPFYKRFVKFIKISSKHQSLPENTSVRERRHSLMKLESAVAEIHKDLGRSHDLIVLLESNDEVKRRASMPARTIKGSTLWLKNRQSRAFFRASLRVNSSLSQSFIKDLDNSCQQKSRED